MQDTELPARDHAPRRGGAGAKLALLRERHNQTRDFCSAESVRTVLLKVEISDFSGVKVRYRLHQIAYANVFIARLLTGAAGVTPSSI